MPHSPGFKLGPYEIVESIGAGGMGEVYRARDARLGRDVAIKVLPASLSRDAERLKRFEQEARAASALNHTNILTIFDIGAHEGAPFLVMELLEGGTLRERLSNPGARKSKPKQSSHLTPGSGSSGNVSDAAGLASGTSNSAYSSGTAQTGITLPVN